MTGRGIQAAIVVVPVHDEAELLDRCLTSLAAAVDAVGAHCEVRVVLDACTDDSALIAARHPVTTVISEFNAVGAARALGVASALAAVSHLEPELVWIANTDADSSVPANWLTVQLALAAAGADVVVGTVRPDFDDLSAEHAQLWLDTHTPGMPNGHTHGANLGVRASSYLEVGGFRSAAEHEDVRLVDECRSAGAVVVASDAAEVVTSGRLVGRTPGGYAGHLRAQHETLALEGARLSDRGGAGLRCAPAPAAPHAVLRVGQVRQHSSPTTKPDRR